MSTTVHSIVAYVEQFGGAREHWERAFSNGMTPDELALLAARLRLLDPPTRVDASGYQVQTEPRFELRAKERRELAVRLIAAGHTDRSMARKIKVSRTTWYRIRREAENGGLTPLSGTSPDAGLRVSKRATVGCSPILHFDATGGDADVEAIRRVLGMER